MIWSLHGRCVGEASQVADEATEEGRSAAVVCARAAEKEDVGYDAMPVLADEGGTGSRFSSSSGTTAHGILTSSQLVRQGEMIK